MRILKLCASLIIAITLICSIFFLVTCATPDYTQWSPFSTAPTGLSKLASMSAKILVNSISVRIHNASLVVLVVGAATCNLSRLRDLVLESSETIVCASVHELGELSHILKSWNIDLRYSNMSIVDPVLNAGSMHVPIITVRLASPTGRTVILTIAVPDLVYVNVGGNSCRGVGYTSPTARLANGTPVPMRPVIYLCKLAREHYLYIIPSCMLFQNRYFTRDVMLFVSNITHNETPVVIIIGKQLKASMLTMLKYSLTANFPIYKLFMLLLVPMSIASFVYLVIDYVSSRKGSH